MIEKPKCKLVGEDGNVFCIIARVAKALKNAGVMDPSVTSPCILDLICVIANSRMKA